MKLYKKLIKQYKSFFQDNFKRYWKLYGGHKALLKSPYLHISLLFAIILFPIWSKNDWWDTVIEIVPSILGFALGGYAILLGFGDEKFRTIISGTDKEFKKSSPYMEVSSTFVHFILVQTFALILAVVSKAYELVGILGFISYLIFLYGLFLIIATTFAVFKMSCWYDIFLNKKEDE